ncbi:MAG: thioredoxin family protein [Pseudomonadota bacterium]|jgi:thiol-disulfide isomerase/thioredoxin
MSSEDFLSIARHEWLVVCLCAEWCGTCRDYRAGFAALAQDFPDAGFLWVDIEDHAGWAGDFDVDNFPTVLIQRGDWVLFYGTVPPQHGHLRRMLESLREQSAAASRDYAHGSAQRREWQAQRNFRAALGGYLAAGGSAQSLLITS